METITGSNIPSGKNRSSMSYILRHKLVFFLLLTLIIVTAWAAIKVFTLKRNFNNEKEQISSSYMEETAKVFSWAIRSEMVRDNRDQVNQFFTNLIKEPGFKKIQLVSISNSKVIISTDKKDEGTVVSDTAILNADIVKHWTEKGDMRIIAPVMGLNSRIGVLVIDRVVPSAYSSK